MLNQKYNIKQDLIRLLHDNLTSNKSTAARNPLSSARRGFIASTIILTLYIAIIAIKEDII